MFSKGLDVWQSKIELPKKLLDRVKDLQVPSEYNESKLRDDTGVDLLSIYQHDAIICDGFVDWHDDSHLGTPYTSMLVLRNDTNSYVRVKNAKPIYKQPVGTLMIMDFRVKHSLTHALKNKAPFGVWSALYNDYDKKPTRKEVSEYYKKFLGKL